MYTDPAVLDREYIWHPFTQMSEWLDSEQIIIDKGMGVFIYDTKGNKYIDGVSSLWCNVHGHAKQKIDRAIQNQLGRIAHSTLLGLGNVQIAKLSEKVINVAPENIKKAFFSENGASAVEVALKMAYQFWQQKFESTKSKKKFVYLSRGYHGDTLGAMSVGGIDLFHELYQPLISQDNFKAPSPYCYRCELGLSPDTCGIQCAKELTSTLEKHNEEIAAVIIEPAVQGAGGMIVAPDGYLKLVEKACRANNVLLIADCVAVGFGRTGKMFACEHENIHPDLMVLGKGLSGGYLPISATLTTQEIFDGFLGDKMNTFFHGHTFGGNQLAAAASNASMDLFFENDFIGQLPGKGQLLADMVGEIKVLDHVGDVRLKGLMGGIELVKDKSTKEPYPAEDRIGMKVCQEAIKRGLWIRPLGDIIVIMPPLCMGKGMLKSIVGMIIESIKAVTE